MYIHDIIYLSIYLYSTIIYIGIYIYMVSYIYIVYVYIYIYILYYIYMVQKWYNTSYYTWSGAETPRLHQIQIITLQ